MAEALEARAQRAPLCVWLDDEPAAAAFAAWAAGAPPSGRLLLVMPALEAPARPFGGTLELAPLTEADLEALLAAAARRDACRRRRGGDWRRAQGTPPSSACWRAAWSPTCAPGSGAATADSKPAPISMGCSRMVTARCRPTRGRWCSRWRSPTARPSGRAGHARERRRGGRRRRARPAGSRRRPTAPCACRARRTGAPRWPPRVPRCGRVSPTRALAHAPRRRSPPRRRAGGGGAVGAEAVAVLRRAAAAAARVDGAPARAALLYERAAALAPIGSTSPSAWRSRPVSACSGATRTRRAPWRRRGRRPRRRDPGGVRRARGLVAGASRRHRGRASGARARPGGSRTTRRRGGRGAARAPRPAAGHERAFSRSARRPSRPCSTKAPMWATPRAPSAARPRCSRYAYLGASRARAANPWRGSKARGALADGRRAYLAALLAQLAGAEADALRGYRAPTSSRRATATCTPSRASR